MNEVTFTWKRDMPIDDNRYTLRLSTFPDSVVHDVARTLAESPLFSHVTVTRVKTVTEEVKY